LVKERCAQYARLVIKWTYEIVEKPGDPFGKGLRLFPDGEIAAPVHRSTIGCNQCVWAAMNQFSEGCRRRNPLWELATALN
jgi:hypothetical protein